MVDSPSTTNYFKGTGFAKWTPTGGVERDLGNIVECKLTPTVTKKTHSTSRQGTTKVDLTSFVDQAVTIDITLDEITADNLSMLLMDQAPDINTAGNVKTVRIMKDSVITGSLTFTGTNDVGNVVDGDFPSVSFGPTSSFSLISSADYEQVQISGDLQAVEQSDGSSNFGTLTVTDAA